MVKRRALQTVRVEKVDTLAAQSAEKLQQRHYEHEHCRGIRKGVLVPVEKLLSEHFRLLDSM